MNCSELYARGLEDNTYVTIDADGLGSNQPFTAYCQLNGSTAYTIIRTSLYLFMNLRCILSSWLRTRRKGGGAEEEQELTARLLPIGLPFSVFLLHK